MGYKYFRKLPKYSQSKGGNFLFQMRSILHRFALPPFFPLFLFFLFGSEIAINGCARRRSSSEGLVSRREHVRGEILRRHVQKPFIFLPCSSRCFLFFSQNFSCYIGRRRLYFFIVISDGYYFVRDARTNLLLVSITRSCWL